MNRRSVHCCVVSPLESRRLLSAQPLTPNVADYYSKSVEFNGYAYFQGRGADQDLELWRTDGTSAGTTKFQDTNPDTAIGVPTPLCVVGTRLYYLVDRGPNKGLWRTDGTTSGTTVVKALPNTTFFKAVAFNGALYMALGDGIWRSDGTAAGTTMIQSTSGTAHELAVVGADLYATNTVTLWRVRAATPTTAEIAFSGSSVASLTAFNGKLYFTNYTAASGTELWKYDGTSASLVSDIYLGAASSSPTQLTVSGSALYFTADAQATGFELWRLGTSGGPNLVIDLVPGTGTPYPYNLTAANGRIFFDVYVGAREQVYYSSGTAATTAALSIGSTGSASSNQGDLYAVGNTLYFLASSAGTRTNGYFRVDPGATVPQFVGDVAPGGPGTGGADSPPGSVGAKFFFSGVRSDGAAGYQLYVDRTDRSSITGRVWQDRNADGTFGSYDSGLGGRTLFLDTDNDGNLDAGEISTLTSTAGGYSFYDLAAGTYHVRQVMPPNAGVQVSPAAAATFTLAAGATASLVDFTDRLPNTGVIAGNIYTDFNHNGVRDGLDLSSAVSPKSTVFVDANNNGQLDPLEISAIASGGVFTNTAQFALLDVPAGTFHIRELPPAGWTDTTNSGVVTGTLTDKGEATGLSFTADPPPASLGFSGITYSDPSHRGYYSTAVTPPLAAATVYLDLDGDQTPDAGEPSRVTDSGGNFQFTGLDYGQYAVRIAPIAGKRAGMTPTVTLAGSPTSPTVSISVYSNLLLVSSAYDADARTMQMIFDRAVKLPAIGAVQVINVATGVPLAAADFSVAVDPANAKALIVRPPANATWPDGRYCVTAAQNAIITSGSFADPLDADLAAPFTVLAGDATGDAKVDFSDLVILAQNYNRTGMSFRQGNFDYSPDGKVDFADLVILAQHYNVVLATSSALLAPIPTRPSSIRHRQPTWDISGHG